jgi:protein associated with RNAse G/E
MMEKRSIKNDSIMMMEKLLKIIILNGEKIEKWRYLKYKDMKEYENLRKMMKEKVDDEKEIMKKRLKMNRYIDKEKGG